MKLCLFLRFPLDGTDRLVADDLECRENDEPGMAVWSAEHRFALERSRPFPDFVVLILYYIHFEKLKSYHHTNAKIVFTKLENSQIRLQHRWRHVP